MNLSPLMELITRLAAGELDARGDPTGESEELDAVIEGLNMLGEELQRSVRGAVRFERLAQLDELTGMGNRRGLEHAFQQRLHARTPEAQLALAYLDLDDFKPINDTYGHEMGDEVLRVAARRLAAEVRDTDYVSRIGGDEFVVLFSAKDDEVAQKVLGRMVSAVEAPIVLGEVSVRVGSSSGCVITPEEEITLDRLLSLADGVMYEDKSRRKDGKASRR